jgi:hypothetical protein
MSLKIGDNTKFLNLYDRTASGHRRTIVMPVDHFRRTKNNREQAVAIDNRGRRYYKFVSRSGRRRSSHRSGRRRSSHRSGRRRSSRSGRRRSSRRSGRRRSSRSGRRRSSRRSGRRRSSRSGRRRSSRRSGRR